MDFFSTFNKKQAILQLKNPFLFSKNKIMKSIILAMLCVLLSIESFAQSLGTGTINNVDPRILRGNQPYKPNQTREIELRGHPFTTEEWHEGSVILRDSSRSVDPKLKFKLNVEDSEIWVMQPDKSERVLTDERIVGLELKIADKVIEYRKVLLPESPTSLRFAQIIHAGTRYSLVKYIKKTFLKADYIDKGLTVVGRKYDSFESVEAYYIISSDKKASKIKLSKGEILKATAAVSRAKQDQILEYCKENDIRNPINEEDAVLMLAFIDKL